MTMHYNIMIELVHHEKKHSDWFPGQSIFCYTDRSQTDFNDWCFWKDIQKKAFLCKVETLICFLSGNFGVTYAKKASKHDRSRLHSMCNCQYAVNVLYCQQIQKRTIKLLIIELACLDHIGEF